jgi:HAD superfamily hydrolase (TIGR01509 family)
MYRAVIFDVDGTLVDSNDAHARAWAAAFAEADLPVPLERIRPLIGMGGDKLLPRLTGIDIESPAGKAIAECRSRVFRERYLPSLKPTPGARQLLEQLHHEGLQLFVASSAAADELDDLLRVAGADELITSIKSSDDASRSKPDPDIVHAALEATGRPARDVVMVGDTPYDVKAAARAALGTIALRCGGWTDAAFVNALAIFDDPADLLDRYNDSPFGQPSGTPPA